MFKLYRPQSNKNKDLKHPKIKKMKIIDIHRSQEIFTYVDEANPPRLSITDFPIIVTVYLLAQDTLFLRLIRSLIYLSISKRVILSQTEN